MRSRESSGNAKYGLRCAGMWLAITAALGLVGACDWGDIDDIPPGFADGVDNDTPTTAGPGLTQSGNELSVAFEVSGSGLGTVDTVARSDHDHDADYVLRAGDTMTGALVLNTGAGTDVTLDETGIDCPSGSAETFNIGNSGGGGMTLLVAGGIAVTGDVTAASFSGNGSGLAGVDADLLGGLDSSAFMTATADSWV
ncbi:MAG: hypothetical protein ACYSU0_23355, partial [Planctomycetota bacterium]